MRGIGFIGGGLAVRDLHVPALESLGLLDRVMRVATSAHPTADAAAEWLRSRGAVNCRASSIEEILEDSALDAVLVAVPIDLTESVARRAVDAKKAAIVEKPIATSTSGAVALLDLAREHGVPLLAGENFRFKSEYSRMRELAADGTIGAVKVIYWNDLHFTPASGKYAETSWRIEGRHRGGYLIDGGTHIVAGLRQLSGASIVAVHALAGSSQAYLSNQEDTLLMNLTFDDGVIGHLALGYGVYEPEARHPKICGDKGTLALMADGIYLVDGAGTRKLEDRDKDQGFVGEWELLQSAIGLDAASVNATHDLTLESIRDLQLLECALKSSATGEEVRLPAVA